MSKPNLKILILNYEFPPLGGGASPVSYEIARQYVEQGHSATVVTMHFKGLPKEELLNGIRVHRVSAMRARRELCRTHEMLTYVISAFWFLRKHLKQETYDICHCHFVIPTGAVAAWCKKRFGLSYILTAHGSDIPGFNAERFAVLHRFTAPFIRYICCNANAITVPSNFLKALLARSVGPLLETAIIVLPNGSKDMRRPQYEKKNIIFSSGRLLQRKGFDLLINAFKQVAPEDWDLYVVGDGPQMRDLKRLAGKERRIHFTGWLDNTSDRYFKIVNQAKIFALLSEAESQGIVFLEAMSAGCAILAPDSTACRETVTPETGLHVDRNNPNMIAQALSTLFQDQRKLSAYMQNSRQRYEKDYRYETVGRRYEEILRYCQSAGEKRGSSA